LDARLNIARARRCGPDANRGEKILCVLSQQTPISWGIYYKLSRRTASWCSLAMSGWTMATATYARWTLSGFGLASLAAI
jgi:hypothetical protein